MPDSQIQLINCKSGDLFPAAPADGVLLSSEHASWNGITIELHHLGPTEMPEHYIEGHRLAINVGPPLQYEWKDNGRWNQVILQPGDFCLQTHGDTNLPRWHNNFRFLAVALDPEFVHQAFRETGVSDPIVFQARRGKTDRAIADFARYFHQELISSSYGGKLYSQSLTLAFSKHLLEQHSKHSHTLRQPSGRLSSRALKHVIEYVHEHLGDNLSLSDLAAEVNLSTYHFARLFKQSLGYSPHQYILQNQVERAQKLIEITDKPNLADIGLTVGFHDQAHFTRAFKRFVGTTPRRFLKQVAS